MRLIDADALKDHLQSLAYDDWNQGVYTSWADAYRECADMVDEQPTIEPERKIGRWIMKYKGSAVTSYKCSECGRTVKDDTGYDVSKDYPFCHCGADMREGAEQDGHR